jgi:putative NADH-flavin reductase
LLQRPFIATNPKRMLRAVPYRRTPMKLVLFGATGHIGQGILDEALARGHEVTAVVRDPSRLPQRHDRLTVVTGDVNHPASWSGAARGSDAAIASLSARREQDASRVPGYARILLGHLAEAGITRLAWVGGAGSLEVAPGRRVIDSPDFPAAWRPEAEAQGEALEVFRAYRGPVEWTYVSPAALLEPGERTGAYRLGGDQLLVDADGHSRISIADYAVALLDRLERRDAANRRITVAY